MSITLKDPGWSTWYRQPSIWAIFNMLVVERQKYNSQRVKQQPAGARNNYDQGQGELLLLYRPDTSGPASAHNTQWPERQVKRNNKKIYIRQMFSRPQKVVWCQFETIPSVGEMDENYRLASNFNQCQTKLRFQSKSYCRVKCDQRSSGIKPSLVFTALNYF